MFWTVTRRAMVSTVAFFVGWAAFLIAGPTPDLRVPAPRRIEISAITLKRQGCSDAELKCPVYETTFRADGTATFIGYANDEFIGTYTAQYTARDFGYLAAQLERQHFFELPNVYPLSPDEETIVFEVSTNRGTRVLTTHNWNSTLAELRVLQAVVNYQTLMVEWDEVKE